jgi:hypothetical protein
VDAVATEGTAADEGVVVAATEGATEAEVAAGAETDFFFFD